MKKTVQVRIDDKDQKKLKEEAEKRGHTISSLVRSIIKHFLSKS